jgi:sensor c-di-GMP phosphodiesterase-like protein
LKIDKQFVEKINISERSTLVTKTIIEMAKQMKLQICAEGVETREQADFLIENGCHQLQGYLFSKPTSLVDLLEQKAQLVDLKKNC